MTELNARASNPLLGLGAKMGTRNPEYVSEGNTRDDLAEQLAKRLSLWAAIGNGLGLAAVGNIVVDKENIGVAHLLIPSGWAFAVGLLFAAFFNMLLALHHRAYARYWRATDPSIEARELKSAKELNSWFSVAFIFAGICFVFGLFYPLTIFSLRFI